MKLSGGRRFFAGSTFVVAAALVLGACQAAEEEPEVELGADALTQRRTVEIDEDPSVLVEHPETLQALERRGFDLGSLLTGVRVADNRAFGGSPDGKTLIDAIDEDIAGAKRKDGAMGIGMTFVHRAFETRWLRSGEAHFELVAVTNRMDRRFTGSSACGELHLVYRLAYENDKGRSRLPMTVMLVYPQKAEGGSCAGTAQRWLGVPRGGSFDARATALASGPMQSLGRANKVEIGFQQVRWPSGAREDMGGHAEYGLRVFERGAGGALEPVPLENTPRTDLSAEDKAALAAWIADNLAGIDRGTAIVPGKFLTTTTISVAPRELARAQNRPYALLFGKDGRGLGELQLRGLAQIGSKTELVRRLDTMTCNGCHQSRSVAGFHILGNDRADMMVVNALVDGISGHTRELVEFRRKDLEQVARATGETPAVGPIPFAEHGTTRGGYAASCGLNGKFPTWKCAAGLSCSDVSGDDVGICVSDVRGAGQACEEAKVSFSADPAKDSVSAKEVRACKLPGGVAGRCNKSSGGFPNGLCSGGCSKVGDVKRDVDAICGYAVGNGFNECVFAKRPFEECLRTGASKQYRRACSAKSPCGPDYVCAAVPDAPAGVGACMPTYFMFQVRVDGHLVDD